MRAALILGLAVLAGCGTPQERCIASATREVRIMDRLIGEVQTNLDRGYAMVKVRRTGHRWEVCRPGRAATATEPARAPQMCFKRYRYNDIEPQAINLAEERVKLAEMRKKRVELARMAEKSVASCKASHPE